MMRTNVMAVVLGLLVFGIGPGRADADDTPESRFPLLASLSVRPGSKLIGYTPSQLDPRQVLCSTDTTRRARPGSSRWPGI